MTSSKSNNPDLLKRPYSDEELDVSSDDIKAKLEKLMKFFDESGIDYDKFDPDSIPKLDFSKRMAYPNNDVYMYIPGQHDTNKWLQAISDIYRQEKAGESRVTAIRRVTSGWNIMETHDFLNWIRFYEAGDHMKYKFANLWYENPDLPGYAFTYKKDPEPVKVKEVQPAIDFARTKATEDADRRQLIEKQRNKIIGRLDSAEKLLRSPDGHVFSGKEFESLMEAIYDLKKKIQMVNKISSSTKLYEDMIVRQANILNRSGFSKAAGVLYSVAQTPAAAGEQAEGQEGGEVPVEPAPPGDPSGAGEPGAPGGLPSTGPGMPQGAPSSAAPESVGNETSPTPKGIIDFLDGLEKSTFSPGDDSEVEDDLEVMDADDELLVTEAQVAPPPTNPAAVTPDESLTTSTAPAPLDPSPVAAPDTPAAEPGKSVEGGEEENLEVTEDDIAQPPGEEAHESTPSNFNAKMDEVLKGVTVADAVAELEDLSKIFKTREIPRRLGRVDMMFDALGIAPYFPSLSEATNKSLEANNYIATRVDDILSKLRGTLQSKEIDLKGDSDVERPEMAGIKGKLQQDEDKEKERKRMRKEQEAAELSNKGKETPEVEIGEDLAPPGPPAAAPKPPAPPA